MCLSQHIQNFGIFGTQAHSEPCLFKHNRAYSVMVVITLTFFFHFNLTFQQNFKRHMFLNDNGINFNS